MSDFDNEERQLSPEEVDDIETTLEMEIEFFKILAGESKIEVVSMPDEDGALISPEELKLLQQECKRQNIKLLYRIMHKYHSTVLDPETGFTGVMPDHNPRGFSC